MLTTVTCNQRSLKERRKEYTFSQDNEVGQRKTSGTDWEAIIIVYRECLLLSQSPVIL